MGLVYILMAMSIFTISFTLFLNAGFHFFFIQLINPGMMLLNLDDILFDGRRYNGFVICCFNVIMYVHGHN